MKNIIKLLSICLVYGVCSCSDLTFGDKFLGSQPESSGAVLDSMFSVSGAGGLGPVLRHLELRGEGTGGGENQRVHLSGAGDHSGGLRADPAGTLHLDDRSRYGTDPDRAASL